jgi:hypothetical protein
MGQELGALRAASSLLPASAPPPAAQVDEAQALASELAAAFGRLVAHYRKPCGLSPEEARKLAASAPADYRQHILDKPPAEVDLCDLGWLAERDPALSLERWEEIKEAAGAEVRSGYRAGQALEGGPRCAWERARFLAVRAELTGAYRPRTAGEQHLVDQLAQWQVLLWQWQEMMTGYARVISKGLEVTRREGAGYDPPRQSAADGLEQAARTVERLHRLYLRTLRALQDQRRLGPPVVVRRAGQVNIGQQQVNVAGRP